MKNRSIRVAGLHNRATRRKTFGILCGAACLLPLWALPLGACSSTPDIVDDEPVVSKPLFQTCEASKDPIGVPLGAGTLATSEDGAQAIASDAERGAIFLIDVSTETSRQITVSQSDRVARVLWGDEFAYAVAEGSGEVLKISVEDAEILGRFPVCSAPRGIVVSHEGDTIYVACASGELVSLDASSGARTRRLVLDPDLKDVAILGEELIVSRLRSAELIVLDVAGEEVGRIRPPSDSNLGEPSVAWRMLVQEDRVFLLYQLASVDMIGGDSFDESGDFGEEEDLDYGSSAFDCGEQLVTAMLSVFRRAPRLDLGEGESGVEPPDGYSAQDVLWGAGSIQIQGAVGALDFGVDAEGMATIVAPGNGYATEPFQSLIQVDTNQPDVVTNTDGCALVDLQEAEQVPVAVAVALGGEVLTQTRETATVARRSERDFKQVTLSSDVRRDSGHRLFHMKANRAISCISCHPGGGDDGHVWNFATFGKRRTQNLHGGVSFRGPLHWDGELEDFSSLMTEVFGSRMGMGEMSPESADCLEDWLDELPDGEAGRQDDEAAAARGKALFEDPDVECSACHSGPHFTDRKLHDVGTGAPLVTPGLVGIGARPPYLHDGCASTLLVRFGVCGGGDQHGKTSHLTDDEVSDLTAYLQSL